MSEMKIKKDDVESKMLKWILSVNYLYHILDDISDTPLYKQGIKRDINSLYKQLDREMKSYIFKTFYEKADDVAYQDNLGRMDEFFTLLTSMHITQLDAVMENFINDYKKAIEDEGNEKGDQESQEEHHNP